MIFDGTLSGPSTKLMESFRSLSLSRTNAEGYTFAITPGAARMGSGGSCSTQATGLRVSAWSTSASMSGSSSPRRSDPLALRYPGGMTPLRTEGNFPIMSPHLTRLILLVALCSVTAGCHRTSFGKAVGYPAPPPKSDLWSD